MFEENNLRLPCDECKRVKKLIGYCKEHDEYFCNKCSCYECLDIENKIKYLERELERKQGDLSYILFLIKELKKNLIV